MLIFLYKSESILILHHWPQQATNVNCKYPFNMNGFWDAVIAVNTTFAWWPHNFELTPVYETCTWVGTSTQVLFKVGGHWSYDRFYLHQLSSVYITDLQLAAGYWIRTELPLSETNAYQPGHIVTQKLLKPQGLGFGMLPKIWNWPESRGIFSGAKNCSWFCVLCEGLLDICYNVRQLCLCSKKAQQKNKQIFLKNAVFL